MIRGRPASDPTRALDPWHYQKGSQLWGRECANEKCSAVENGRACGGYLEASLFFFCVCVLLLQGRLDQI